jgi:hypothetical protein
LSERGCTLEEWMKTLALAVCAVLMLYASTADAVPVDVTESIDFDNSSPNLVGTLAVGVNSVKGAVGPGDNTDTFRMILPAGLVIKKGQLIVTNFFECGTPCDLNLHGRITEPLDGTTEILSSTTLSFAGVPFAKPGNLDAELVAALGLLDFIPIEGSFDYDLQYEVGLFTGEPGENTPEPGTLLMLAGGAVALALRRRRPRPTR